MDEMDWIIYFGLPIIAFFLFFVYQAHENKKKSLRKIRESFGKKADKKYLHEEFENISHGFYLQGNDNNIIDDIVTAISNITYEMYLIHVVVIYSIGIYVYKIGYSVLLAYISVLLGTVCCAYSLHYITKKILWNTKESEKKDEKSGNHRSLL